MSAWLPFGIIIALIIILSLIAWGKWGPGNN